MRLCTRLTSYDYYERHAVVSILLRRALERSRGLPCQILDVGGQVRSLTRFVPYHVTALNVDCTGDVRYDGTTIPFPDNSFDAVTCVDTLEHLPKDGRIRFIRECLRVAGGTAVIAAPLGSTQHIEHEKRLASIYLALHGRPHRYLDEHIRYQLPDLNEVYRIIGALQPVSAALFFAGNFVWQGNYFEQAIVLLTRRGLMAALHRAYIHVSSLALFHPVRLRSQPEVTSNRFYLLLTSQI